MAAISQSNMQIAILCYHQFWRFIVNLVYVEERRFEQVHSYQETTDTLTRNGHIQISWDCWLRKWHLTC